MGYLKGYISKHPDRFVYAVIVYKSGKSNNGKQRFIKAFRYHNIEEAISKMVKWFKGYFLRNKHSKITGFKIKIYDKIKDSFIDEEEYYQNKKSDPIFITKEYTNRKNYWIRNIKKLLSTRFKSKKIGGNNERRTNKKAAKVRFSKSTGKHSR